VLDDLARFFIREGWQILPAESCQGFRGPLHDVPLPCSTPGARPHQDGGEEQGFLEGEGRGQRRAPTAHQMNLHIDDIQVSLIDLSATLTAKMLVDH
jgi:hypothetical protein